MSKYYWKELNDDGYGHIEIEGSNRVYPVHAIADKLNELEAEAERLREVLVENKICPACEKNVRRNPIYTCYDARELRKREGK